MLELIEKGKLGDDDFNIWRIKPRESSDDATRFLRFILATTGYDNPYCGRRELSYWRIYFHHAFAGKNHPDIEDYFYFAEVNGNIAARLWFAYAPINNFGNFGNVFTAPEFRKRGILRRIMPYCIRDFAETSAKCLACSTGSEFAARTYADYGFQTIYGGKTGEMALVKPEPGSFSALDADCFDDVRPKLVRDGCLSDQFMIDKFLCYCRDFHETPPRNSLMDYRCCMQEVSGGNGKIAVVENAAGIAVGFAWAGNWEGIDRLTFLIHPRAIETAAELLLRVFELYGKRPLLYLQNSGDTPAESLLAQAGACRKGGLSTGAMFWELNDKTLPVELM